MTRYIIPIALIALLGALGIAWGFGHAAGVADEKAKIVVADNERLQAAFEQGQELGAVKEVVVTQYVERDRIIQGKTKTIIKEVPVYVSEAADRACTVPAGFVRVYDASATNVPLAGPGGTADEAPSGVALSDVAAVTAENFGTCHAIANQLTALQDFLRKSREVVTKEQPQ